MNPFTLDEEQIDKICGYLKKKYPPNNYKNDCGYGVNCACSHCPFGNNSDGYGKVWDCMSYMAGTNLSEELEKVVKGELNIC